MVRALNQSGDVGSIPIFSLQFYKNEYITMKINEQNDEFNEQTNLDDLNSGFYKIRHKRSGNIKYVAYSKFVNEVMIFEPDIY